MAGETRAAELKDRIEQESIVINKNLESVYDELGKVEVEGSSDKNLVKFILTGHHEIKKLSIDPSLLKESNKFIEESILEAYRDAKVKIEVQIKLKTVEAAKIVGFYEDSE